MTIKYWLIEHPNPHLAQMRTRQRLNPLGKVGPTGLAIIHTAETDADQRGPDSGAENVANFISNRTTYGSYHSLVDSDSVVPVVPFTHVAFGDGTGSNDWATHFSFGCSARQWSKELSAEWRHEALVNMAHELLRFAKWLWATHKIDLPARRVTRAESERGLPGLISHAERDPGRRTDPGKDFPWDRLLAMYADLKREWKEPRPDNVFTVGLLNTHVGVAWGKGIVKQLEEAGVMRQLDLLNLAEVRDMDKALDALGAGWSMRPKEPLFKDNPKAVKERRDPALAFVATRRATMRLRFTEVQDITFGSKHLRQNATVGVEHRKTGLHIVDTSAHFTHGRRHTAGIRAQQGEFVADRLLRVAPDRLAMAGGDLNETWAWAREAKQGATMEFREAGLKSAAEVLGQNPPGVDDLWFRPMKGVRLIQRKEFRFPAMREGVRRGHPFVMLSFAVTGDFK